jgi:hypothetical protein
MELVGVFYLFFYFNYNTPHIRWQGPVYSCKLESFIGFYFKEISKKSFCCSQKLRMEAPGDSLFFLKLIDVDRKILFPSQSSYGMLRFP